MNALHLLAIVFAIRGSGTATGIDRIAVSPDGQTLAVIADHGTSPVELYDAKTLKETFTFPARNVNVSDLAFSPDGRLLAACTSEYLAIYNSHTKRLVKKLQVNRNGPLSVAFSPQGRPSCNRRGTWRQPLECARLAGRAEPLRRH